MITKLKIHLLIIFSFILKETNSQNLVANSSFEDVNTCFEFKANCSPAAWFVVDSKDPYQLKPVSGARSLSFTFGNLNDPGLKTFPYTRTLCPILPGFAYDFKIWIHCGSFEFTHLEVLLSKQDPTRIKKTESKHFTFRLDKSDIKDRRPDGWVLLEKIFTLEETANFILLGNLSNEDYPGHYISIAKKDNGNIVFSIDDIYLTGLDSTVNKCEQYHDVMAALYAETHRHTSFVYLDADQRIARIKEFSGDRDLTDSISNFKKQDTLIIPGILFKSGSSEIKLAHKKMLDTVINRIARIKVSRIEIRGYTDDVGSDEQNMKLSKARAQAIEIYIINHLPKLQNKIYSDGFGKNNPLARNNNEKDRAKNRRVELFITRE